MAGVCLRHPCLCKTHLCTVEALVVQVVDSILKGMACGALGSPHALLLTAWADLEQKGSRCACRCIYVLCKTHTGCCLN